MRTPASRRQYSRDYLHDEADSREVKGSLIEPLLTARHVRGRLRRWSARLILHSDTCPARKRGEVERRFKEPEVIVEEIKRLQGPSC
jgi:hypothetical protein